MSKSKGPDKEKRSAYIPSILCLIHGLCNYHGKMYVFPAQTRIMSLLMERFNINISRATLNRHLRDTEDKGFIKRVRRIRYDKKLGTVFKSTLYEITLSGYQYLFKCGVNCIKQIKILQNYLKRLFQGPDKKDKYREQSSGLETVGSIIKQLNGLIARET